MKNSYILYTCKNRQQYAKIKEKIYGNREIYGKAIKINWNIYKTY